MRFFWGYFHWLCWNFSLLIKAQEGKLRLEIYSKYVHTKSIMSFLCKTKQITNNFNIKNQNFTAE